MFRKWQAKLKRLARSVAVFGAAQARRWNEANLAMAEREYQRPGFGILTPLEEARLRTDFWGIRPW